MIKTKIPSKEYNSLRDSEKNINVSHWDTEYNNT